MDFGVVQLRIFGQSSYKVTEPLQPIPEVVGTKGLTKRTETSEVIVDWLKDQIVAVLNDTLGELKAKKQMGVLDFFFEIMRTHPDPSNNIIVIP